MTAQVVPTPNFLVGQNVIPAMVKDTINAIPVMVVAQKNAGTAKVRDINNGNISKK